tara:strand:+ start:381 stop:575 length:195 start_codon:yes stop_codon:yes gene_type:complete
MKAKIFFYKNNFSTQDVKIVSSSKKDIEFEDLKNKITVIELEEGLKAKVLTKKTSTDAGNYMGL